jgi:centrin-3
MATSAHPTFSNRPYTAGLSRPGPSNAGQQNTFATGGFGGTGATAQAREAQRIERERAERAEKERQQNQFNELSEEQREEINEAVRLSLPFNPVTEISAD